MTADFYQFDMKFLAETVTRIINISSVRIPMILLEFIHSCLFGWYQWPF